MITRDTLLKKLRYIFAISFVVGLRGFGLAYYTGGVYLWSSFIVDTLALSALMLFGRFLYDRLERLLVAYFPSQTRKARFSRFVICFLFVAFVFFPFILTSIQLHPQKLGNRLTPSKYGIEYEDVTFPSGSLELEAWLLKGSNRSTPVIVLAHGVNANRSNFLPFAAAFHKAGFTVFMFDFRAHGDSGGRTGTIGFVEQEDVKAAYDWLKDKYPSRPIAAVAYSMGGAAVLHAEGRYQLFDRLVIDSSFSRLERVAGSNYLDYLGPFSRPVWQLCRFWAWVWTGADIAEHNPEISVANIPPEKLFFIHGKADSMIPYEESHRLFEASDKKATLWLIDGANHLQSLMHPEYVQNVTRFLSKE